MTNVTLRAPEQKIEHARRVARERRTTLNRLFLEWLDQLDGGEVRADQCAKLLKRIDANHCNAGGSFTREEMNER